MTLETVIRDLAPYLPPAFGALVGRGGAKGAVYFVGMKWNGANLPLARLQFAINDNRHWQNNLGSYRVTLRVSDAYDVGEAQ